MLDVTFARCVVSKNEMQKHYKYTRVCICVAKSLGCAINTYPASIDAEYYSQYAASSPGHFTVEQHRGMDVAGLSEQRGPSVYQVYLYSKKLWNPSETFLPYWAFPPATCSYA